MFSMVLVTSCNYQKKLHEQLYLNDTLDSSHRVLMSYSPTVKIDDRLLITVGSLYPEVALPYNLPITASLGYLVDKDGTILFPQLGKIQVEGKTLVEIRSDLLGLLTKYLTDPVVTIQFANAKVLVMGEVGHPGPIPIPDGKLTIFDAISLSGDIPFTGRKDNVLVVREVNGERNFTYVNLQSHNIYKSPFFYLKQNDMVYVEPTMQKVKQQSNQLFLTNIGLITSVTSVLTSLFFLMTYLKIVK